jgi:hypothetical protein
MRVYAPATRADLLRLHTDGRWAPTGPCFAVTDELRGWVESDGPVDDEQLELVALTEAARESLRLLGPLAAGSGATRVVLAVDLGADQVAVDDSGPQDPPGRVRVLAAQVPLATVAAVHADEDCAAAAVASAAAALAAADGGDPVAEALVGRLDDHDLLWFDPAELAQLVGGRADPVP